MPSVHHGLLAHLRQPVRGVPLAHRHHAGQNYDIAGSLRAWGVPATLHGGLPRPHGAPAVHVGALQSWGVPIHAVVHPVHRAPATGFSVHKTHTGAARPKHGLRLMHVHDHAGQTYTTDDGDTPDGGAAGDSGDQTNTPAVSTDSGDGGIVSTLLGDIGIDPGTVASAAGDGTTPSADGGSTQVQTATSQSFGSDSGDGGTGNTLGSSPGLTVGPSGGSTAPVTPAPSPSPIVPAASAKSNLLWWIVGGVAVVAVGFVLWRVLGHKGATTAAKTAAKAASYFRYGYYY